MEGDTMAEIVSGKVGHALISVSDKRGLESFARRLHQQGIVLYSTGGTRSFLESHGIPVLDIAAYTGFPEVMDRSIRFGGGESLSLSGNSGSRGSHRWGGD
jgi:hypothetical protein